MGSKGENVVIECEFGSPTSVNDGVTVVKEVELEDPFENIGANCYDLTRDGTTTSIVLVQGIIAERVKVVVVGANPVLITRVIVMTKKASVSKPKECQKKLEDSELANVPALTASNNEIGNIIVKEIIKVGRRGVVYPSRRKNWQEDNKRKGTCEHFGRCYQKWKLVLIIAEDIEQEPLATLLVNRLGGSLKVAPIKAPRFVEWRREYLDDIAMLTEGIIIREEVGLMLDNVGPKVLGRAAKVVPTKGSTRIIDFSDWRRDYLDDLAMLTGGTVIMEEVGLTLDKADPEVLDHVANVVLTKDSTTIVDFKFLWARQNKFCFSNLNTVWNYGECFKHSQLYSQ
ncbi:hypothetical protein Cgig2_033120 [Carnegiea gigantea]|uniref:Uncharacterized protein n=1 Tax=Carnegiea gigantea TaxID=171969 RepID=A0A9Q1GKK8_9CARY|nr:hypothetical protein Cgig2_033120 [Carnegiea gigantea]